MKLVAIAGVILALVIECFLILALLYLAGDAILRGVS